jgi:formylglycine-generating enzyme required for sulfatase activity
MHGNVWEWCEDEWHDDYEGAPTDGSAWVGGGGGDRVDRGGAWYGVAFDCRSANRFRYMPSFGCGHVGFRLLRAVPA